MRVWHISPAYLDQKRLVAAHREIHMLLTCVLRGQRWGPTEILKHSLQYAKHIHDITVMELFRRAKGRAAVLEIEESEVPVHPTPFEIPVDPDLVKTLFEPSRDHFIQDIQDLRNKWDRELYYYGTGRLDLRDLEKEYGLKNGVSPSDAEKLKSAIHCEVKNHREWFNEYRSSYPKSRMQDRIQAFLLVRKEIIKKETANEDSGLTRTRMAEGHR